MEKESYVPVAGWEAFGIDEKLAEKALKGETETFVNEVIKRVNKEKKEEK